MSCIPNTPIAKDWRDSGWQSYANVSTTAPATWYPIDIDVLEFPNMAESTAQGGVIRQLVVREVAAAAADKKLNDLSVYIWNQTAPTAPTIGSVYNPNTSNLVGVVQITSADYERISDTVSEARVDPDIHFTTGTGNTAINFHAVALYSNATPTAYTASAQIQVRMFTELGQVTA
jgi:hypothetical protein